MELRHLRYFVAVAEELHFGRAAARLSIAQPPLSHQIQQLEKELGVCLFQRTKRRVSLTEPGRAFLEQARISLAHADRAASHARMAAQGQFGQVTVAFVDVAMLVGSIPAAVREFRSRHPGVKLTLQQMASATQISMLKDGRIDVGMIVRGPACDETVVLTPLFHEPWVVAMPADHALAVRPELRLVELAGEPLIFLSHQREFGSFDEFARLCHAAGFAPHFVEEASGTLAGLGLVAAGLGVAMVAATTASIQFPYVVFRPLAEPTPGLEIVSIRRRYGASPTALAFAQVLAECAATNEPCRQQETTSRI